MTIKLDAKFYGEIRKAKDDSIVPPDQWMAFLVKDKAFLPTLLFYREKCREMGCDQEHMDCVDRTITRTRYWQQHNPELMKVPDAKNEKVLA